MAPWTQRILIVINTTEARVKEKSNWIGVSVDCGKSTEPLPLTASMMKRVTTITGDDKRAG